MCQGFGSHTPNKIFAKLIVLHKFRRVNSILLRNFTQSYMLVYDASVILFISIVKQRKDVPVFF